MVKDVKFNENDNVRDQILAGVETLAKAVKCTLGPGGRNVLIETGPNSAPRITKDGVSVAKEIQLPSDPENRFKNIGAQLVKEAASRTASKAGDGTTTSTVLAEAIYRKGLRFVAAGCNPVDVKRGIDIAVNEVKNFLKEKAKPITDHKEIAQVATISANGDEEIGSLIADAMERVGKDGVITVQESKGTETSLNVVEGLQFERGYLSPYFLKDDKTEIVLDKPYILIHDKKIGNLKDIVNILQAVSQSGKPLLIIADDVEGEALPTLILNNIRGTITCVAVKAPSYGDNRKNMLQDIATITGGKFISEDLGFKLNQSEIDDLGVANRVVITKDKTTIVEGHGNKEEIDARVEGLRKQIEETTNDFDRSKLKERLAKISGGVAVISVGASSEVELSEKKDRIDDALHATKAAVDSGILPGGGVALARATEIESLKKRLESTNDSIRDGIHVLMESLTLPLLTICSNTAKISGEVVLHEILSNEDWSYGCDLRQNKYCDLFEAGVVDPTNVTITALESAASVAGMLLTTEAVIANVPEEKSAMQGMPPMM